jgi:hypothetical protein
VRGIRELSKAILMLDTLTGMEGKVTRGLGAELDPALDALGDLAADSVHGLLQDMGDDHALLEQLTPSSLELFNNATGRRDGVAYGCVVAMAPPPSLRRRLKVGVDPYGQASYAVYALLHRLTSSLSPRQLPELSTGDRIRLQDGLGTLPRESDSDGFVPTLSQIWGTIVSASTCDHLDLMGYYGRQPSGPALDLLACGADFDAVDFESVWTAVARFGLGTPDYE